MTASHIEAAPWLQEAAREEAASEGQVLPASYIEAAQGCERPPARREIENPCCPSQQQGFPSEDG